MYVTYYVLEGVCRLAGWTLHIEPRGGCVVILFPTRNLVNLPEVRSIEWQAMGGSEASLELCTVTPGGRPSYIPAYLVIDVWGALGGIGGPRGSGSCLAAGWMIDALSVLLLRLVYLVSTW
jgi:hypothetical protein